MKPIQLLCTFLSDATIYELSKNIVASFNILYNKIFVLQDDKDNYLMTYNIKSTDDTSLLPNTILVHRKKQTNTLYTINALNKIVENNCNGVKDSSYQLNWDKFENSILYTNNNEIINNKLKIFTIIYLIEK